ncbi:ligase-associated DNA damage response endonuclease PdeM [Cognatishimia sp. F0-27]|uniref:ligase-associated DNA damage response endonuclease PdeM n=1 Tax=Cognatishimia sp. F0-27 TaxID=2816855 RepID=UPI001D0BFDDC|nr:ligase-associated DNA damage response endonuclease PdeM [Cognatishimia sp. F0-27]MCC1493916.1 ligase-associated DNA damage response endonuclease PdeM [Cognatishimia sp. F0-27]
MNVFDFTFCGTALQALSSGALHWPDQRLLVVSDLHFGKSARLSAIGGAQLPPYETRETLTRLETDIAATRAEAVICLGDSFDAVGLDGMLPQAERDWITRLVTGLRWTWIEGNHDPAPVAFGGAHCAEHHLGAIAFRHIASQVDDGTGEVSGHYHPKAVISARGRAISRPCFLVDDRRLILPAYGTYTGGLRCDSPVFSTLMRPGARAILTGPRPRAIPMPRGVPA